MIMQPTFPDNPKTLMLKQQIGLGACEIILRLYGYAQTSKSSNLGRVDAGYIKTISRYGGSKEKLWRALTEPQLPGKGPWLDIHADGSVHVHDFDHWNKGLLACRNNGKAGAPTTARPTANPPHPLQGGQPLTIGLDKKDGTGLDESSRAVLNGLYGRKEGSWSFFEESTLFELQKRVGFAAELTATVAYRRSLALDQEKFFPHTLARLLDRWTEIQDVVVAAQQKKGAPAKGRERGELLQELALARAAGDDDRIKTLQEELHPK